MFVGMCVAITLIAFLELLHLLKRTNSRNDFKGTITRLLLMIILSTCVGTGLWMQKEIVKITKEYSK